MTITLILIVVFLTAILFQMAFLGRYISITQNIFNNKTFASFGLGAVAYFALTFLVIFPFIWVQTPILWLAIVTFIKDFFTVIFLIYKRRKIKVWKFDFTQVISLIVIGVVLPIFYYYGLSKWVTFNSINSLIVKKGQSDIFQTYNLWIKSLQELTRSQEDLINNLLINPIVSIILFSSIAGIYFQFIHRKNIWDIFILIILTFLFLLLFNMKIRLSGLLFLPLILLLVQHGYNIIMFSRRRFGSFFGIVSIEIWMINPFAFWAIFFIGIATSLLYILLRKRRPSIFIVQILSPMLVLTALIFANISIVLAFAFFVLAIGLYASIFFFGRIKWVERTNVLFSYAGYIWLIFSVVIICVVAAILSTNYNDIWSLFIFGNNPITNYDIPFLDEVQSIIYYVVVGVLTLIIIYALFKKQRITKWLAMIILTYILILISFNPALQIIFKYSGVLMDYQYLKLAIFPILLIIAASKLSYIKKATK